MQMMNVLKPIAFDVVQCMSQLFDYYMYSVRILYICKHVFIGFSLYNKQQYWDVCQ